MSVELPDVASLTRISDGYGLQIDSSDMQIYEAAAGGLLQSWNRVEELYTEIAPVQPVRQWETPAAAANANNAWYVTSEIRESMQGSLAGRRIAVKDNTAVAGIPMMNGSRTLEGFVPAEDATVVRRLLDAGAVIAGKATCEDLCFSGGSHTSKPHAVRNPWDHNRSAAGSSSGSAVLVATGEVDMAVGGDQGGSVRMPAAWCGVVGHKPTFGLVPYTGAFPIEQSIDHLGPIARTVTDTALMLSVMAGVDGKDPRQPTSIEAVDYVAALQESADGLSVGVVVEGFGRGNSDSGSDEVVRRAIEELRTAGLQTEDVSIPWHLDGTAVWDVIATEGATWQMVDGNGYGMNWKGRYDPELIAYYGAQSRRDASQFSETVKLVTLAGRHAIDTEYGRHYAMARNLEAHLAAAYDEALQRYDVLVMPTMPLLPTLLPADGAPIDEVLGRGLEMIGNTCPFDVTGHPACTVPAGMSEGLPVGLMIIGRRFDDATVLRVAKAFETAVGGFPTLEMTRSIA
ncbi:amidase [Rhodococcus sp. YH3-3]|uniref:amidase n=1 Tax=Rhodococcus sp. YH3-3 TaxID=1803579 RepID=UPI0007DB4061|nr:amidase [Rhodococcus sp. YH3-3]